MNWAMKNLKISKKVQLYDWTHYYSFYLTKYWVKKNQFLVASGINGKK